MLGNQLPADTPEEGGNFWRRVTVSRLGANQRAVTAIEAICMAFDDANVIHRAIHCRKVN